LSSAVVVKTDQHPFLCGCGHFSK